MLKNIKSIRIINKIFQPIIYERKLRLIKYNKNLQNKNDIDIEYYKVFSGRYIILYDIKKRLKKEKNMIYLLINYYLKENI